MSETGPPRRTLLGYLTWAATALVAAVTLAHAVSTGQGWGGAAAGAVLFLLYGFLPRLQAANARRLKDREARVIVDDWGVRRDAGEVHEAIAWPDIAWVRIYTTSDGPGTDDVFFALGAGNGKGCVVPLGLAVPAKLLEALQQRLPGLDSAAAVMAMGSTTEAVFTIWTRPGGPPEAGSAKGRAS